MTKRIISASYKDDTPAFFSEEFFADYRKGYRTLTSKYGPMRVSLKPEDTLCFVFWTKNPSDHFIQNMASLRSPFYIQWTITPYDNDIETNLPPKDVVVERFKHVSRLTDGHVVWRYDPIIASPTLTPEYHAAKFEELAAKLEGYSHTCVISFMDEYGKISRECRETGMRAPTLQEIHRISSAIAQSAARHGFRVQTCAEAKYNLSQFGIHEGACIDADYIENTLGVAVPETVKHPGSFRRCLCVLNTDIGSYHRCLHGCKYCYAK